MDNIKTWQERIVDGAFIDPRTLGFAPTGASAIMAAIAAENDDLRAALARAGSAAPAIAAPAATAEPKVPEMSLQQIADTIGGKGVMSPAEFRRFLNGDGVEMFPHQIARMCNLFAAAPTTQHVSAAPAAPTDGGAWKQLFWSVAQVLHCLPSTYVDGNAHVIKQAAEFASIAKSRLAAPTAAQKEWASEKDAMSQAARDVLAERRRQVEVEGWHPDQDDDYEDGQLPMAAACYARQGNGQNFGPPPDWPWDRDWWKPTDERRNLVKAGALILADIERIDRAAMSAAQAQPKDTTDTQEPAEPCHVIGCDGNGHLFNSRGYYYGKCSCYGKGTTDTRREA